MKDVFYFPHDYSARRDPKISALFRKYGMEGYGLYWSVVEILYEQNGEILKFPALFEGLSEELGVDSERLKSFFDDCINRFWLFREDEEAIWSESVLRRLEVREEKRQQKVEAGRIGGKRSGASRRRSETKRNEAVLHENEANEAKERKGKENKVNNKNTASPTSSEVVLEKTDCQKACDLVYQQGFNIYQLIGRVNKERKSTVPIPDKVILGVCNQFMLSKPKIENHWAWFIRVLNSEIDKFNAERNEKEGESYKKDRNFVPAIADIMKGVVNV